MVAVGWHFGDVVWADLDPSAGHEQAKRRPFVVVSNDRFNAHCSLVMAIPVTSSDTGYPLHIGIGSVPAEGNQLSVQGFAEAEQLKALDFDARNAVKVGTIDEEGMEKILGLVLSCLVGPDMMILSGY